MLPADITAINRLAAILQIPVVADGSGTQRSLHCWHHRNLKIEEIAAEADEDINNGGFAEVCEFVHALRSGRNPAPSIEDISPSARICLTIADQARLENTAELS